MADSKGAARIIGILFIVASVTAVIGGSLAALPIQEDDYLRTIGDQRAQVVTGALLLVVQTIAVVGIAVLAFPVLKRLHEGLALGYAAVRTLEGALVLVGATSALAILTLGESGVEAAQPAGDALVAVYDWAYLLGPTIMFSISALIFYPLLMRGHLVPTWLSVWGLVGGILLLVRAVLEMYGVDLSAAVQAVLVAPIGINEMVLAVWLIVKGFDTRSLSAHA
jgi:hypothetical protein